MHVYIHLLAFLMSVDDLKLKVKNHPSDFIFCSWLIRPASQLLPVNVTAVWC
jgi:hypothetical protein